MITCGKLSDFIQESQQITTAFYEMAVDLAHVYQMIGVSVNEETLIDAYISRVEGPSIFEKILVEEGKISRDELKQNPLSTYLFRALGKIIDGDDS